MPKSDEEKAELLRRLMILKSELEKGKIEIAPHLAEGFRESLGKVRYGANGLVDLSTVDGRVRALAMMITVTKDREDLKSSTSLSQIQETYFSFIEGNFGGFFKEMQKHGVTPSKYAYAVSRSSEAVSNFCKAIPELLDALTDFWSNAGPVAEAHLSDANTLKAVFGGDLFPSSEQNIASVCGLYADTIIVPEPFLKTRSIFKNWPPEDACYYLIKHGLNVLQYKDLALSDLTPPIVAILPNRVDYDDQFEKFLVDVSERATIRHTEKLFGRPFENMEDIQEFAGPLDTPEKAVSALNDPARLLFDTTWGNSKPEQFLRYHENFGKHHFSVLHAGQIIVAQSIGRMRQATDIVLKSEGLRGVPIIDAPTSWRYFNWQLEYSARAENETDPTPLHTIRALQAANEAEMQWIGRIPTNALIEIRKTGAIHEIRGRLIEGIGEIATLKPDNFFRTADKVVENLQATFSEHQRELRALREKKMRFAGVEVGTWIVSGSIEVAAAVLGTPFFGVTAIAAKELLDPPKLRELPSRARELIKEEKRIRSSASGVLFNLSKSKKRD